MMNIRKVLLPLCAMHATAQDNSNTTTTTTVPTKWHQVFASYHAQEVLPLNSTEADLMACDPYMSGKKAGLALALNVPEYNLVITGFLTGNDATTTSPRRLENGEMQYNAYSSSDTDADSRNLQDLGTGNLDVKTEFTVSAISNSDALTIMASVIANAAAIKTNVDAQMALQDFSSEPKITSAPTITGTVGVNAPLINQLTVISSGSWSVNYFTDASCSTADTSTTMIQGHVGTCTRGAVTTANSVLGTSCGTQLFIDEYVGTAVCSVTDATSQFNHVYNVDVCSQESDADGNAIQKWSKVSCSTAILQESSATRVSGVFCVLVGLMLSAGFTLF